MQPTSKKEFVYHRTQDISLCDQKKKKGSEWYIIYVGILASSQYIFPYLS